MTTQRDFCTYFDHRYASMGLALHASLQRHCPGSRLWVLCLDEECERLLRAIDLPGIHVVPLAELEHRDPQLAGCRATRSLVEYYFTLSPCLPKHLFATHPEIESITYLDSDLYFFSRPGPIFDEIGAAPVAITPHRFPSRRAPRLLKFGRYNVGWLTFQRSAEALNCLSWWRDRCIEWCYDRVEPARFADQKYLDSFESLFPATHVIRNIGANVAPWNVEGVHVTQAQGIPRVDGDPVVYFHFQALRKLRDDAYDTNLDDYHARLTPSLREYIYLPYLRDLQSQSCLLRSLGLHAEDGRHLRSSKPASVRDAVGILYTALRARACGSIITT